MLYKKNAAEKLSDELFKNPTSEYRGTPFWAWNCKLELAELCRQIEVFKEMGLGGFHMHVRTGLDTEYLSDEYMDIIKGCVEKAKKEEMLAWLYDEDRWPSGGAGGIVTKDHAFRQRSLIMSPEKTEGDKLLACYDIVLDSDAFLSSYRRIGETDEAQGKKWYACLHIAQDDSWHNGQAYVDTLNEKAIQKFIEVTHERYKEKVGADFGEAIPAIFTDEPQFSRKQVLGNSVDCKAVSLPWTDGVPCSFRESYGYDILDSLPELFWEKPNGEVSLTRYHYHDHISALFTQSFAMTCGKWCGENGIALTGHMMEEPTLRSQTAALGETMRSYKGFQLPGIDMLCANFEFTTAKQAQSAAHQYGREGVLSELYGVTGWNYDFRGYKLHGDWQAALGVTVRVPHLSWASMHGAAKRDYPASIHYQSPWYKKFRVVEDHFGRVNTALTRGKPDIRIGVIHPVESFWLHWGPNDKTELVRSSMDRRFLDMTDWLLKGSVDFNFISESLLPELCQTGSAPLRVGCMEYDTVLVPGCETLRSTTLERLEKFKENGGKLVFMGDAPKYENAILSERGKKLYESSIRISFDRAALLQELENDSPVTLRFADGRLTNDLIYQLRSDNTCKWLFIAHCAEPYNKDISESKAIRIKIKGEYTPYLYDTLTGDIRQQPCDHQNGCTYISREVYAYDSLLLRLDSGRSTFEAQNEEKTFEQPITIPEKVSYILSEPNALLLDMAQTKVNEEEYLPREELLRADNIWRKRKGLAKRTGSSVQPWVIKKEPEKDTLTLRFVFESDILYEGAKLALEEPERATVTFNGEQVKLDVNGWYVDRDIKTVSLPAIRKGENELTVTIPFGPRSNTEWYYILGDFGVRVEGSHGIISQKPEKIAFGSVLSQGFPFYGGNITYLVDFESTGDTVAVSTPHFRGALCDVTVDGVYAGDTAYMPYCVEVPCGKGKHRMELTAYGHRYNGFGAVHNADLCLSWHGPGAWETSGTKWSEQYFLRETLLLSAPVIKE